MTNPELKSEVEILIDEVERTHRYSMSRIYSLWNVVYSKNEIPQSCASCLIRKVRDLKAWLEEVNAKDKEAAPAKSSQKKVRKTTKATKNG